MINVIAALAVIIAVFAAGFWYYYKTYIGEGSDMNVSQPYDERYLAKHADIKPSEPQTAVREEKQRAPDLPDNQNAPKGATVTQTNPDPVQPGNQLSAGWKTYDNDKYGIRFSYPPAGDFKSLDWQSASELLARGTANNMDEARTLARKAFDPQYKGEQLYVSFGAYSLGVGIMSVGLDEMMEKRTELLVSDTGQSVSETMIGGVRAKKITIIPKNKILPFWEAHIVAVKNNFVYDFMYSGILGSEGKGIDEAVFNKGVAMLDKIAATAIFTDNMNSEAVKQLIESQKKEALVE